MSGLVVVVLCSLAFLAGAAAVVALACWLSRSYDLSEEQRRRAAEQELQRLAFAAMAQMLAEARQRIG
ncbi:hypothetical protein [Nocardioides marmoraquaticus]